jgi:serine/threonine protein kinase
MFSGPTSKLPSRAGVTGSTPPEGGGPSCLGPDGALAFIRDSSGGLGAPDVHEHLDHCARCRVLVAEAAEVVTGAGRGGSLRALAAGERILERYAIQRYIACGGMGEVYEAVDTVLGDRVAVKTLLSTALDDQASVQRFLDEVRLARKVSHANVCRILELGMHRPSGRSEALPFLTMEFLEGETLAERLARVGRLDRDTTRRILGQIVAGLGAIHAAGIVHRDLKSENVFLVTDPGGEERAVVMDFGLARALASPTQAAWASASGSGGSWSATDGLVGTPDYMAPEQVEGRPPAPAFDIYAVGIIGFEMLTGVKPFAADTPFGRAVLRLQKPAPCPSSLVPGLPPAWDALIGSCLERDPARRFARVEEIAAALEALPPRPPGRSAGRPRKRTLAVLATLAALAAGAAVTLRPAPSPTVASPPGSPVLRYTFENALQGWMDLRYEYYLAARTRVRPSTARALEGRHALEIQIRTTTEYTTPTIGVYEQFLDRLPAGTEITYHVWFPRAEPFEGIQPYVLYHRNLDPDPIWGAQGILPISSLRPGQWNAVKLRVPADVGPDGVIEVGMEWRTNGAQTETVYMDAISW